MLDKQAAKARKLGKGMITLITFLIIAAAAFQIHRLSRASISRAVDKYTSNNSEPESASSVLDRSTADAPPRKGSLSDVGGPADSPANGENGAEPNPADAPADPQ